MSKFLALSPKDCEGKRWTVPEDFRSLESSPLIPLHAGELAKAATSMPTALTKQGSDWQLVGVCGISDDRNLMIKDGKWLGHYQPAWLTTHPFYVMHVAGSGLVVVDNTAGLISTEFGEPFFDESGEMTSAVAQRVETLKAQQGVQNATRAAIEALVKAKVVQPWPDNLKSSLGITIEGLHMVNEKALMQLDDAAFLALRKAQALPLAYSLNFSIHQAHLLLRLARLHGVSSGPTITDNDELDLEFLNDSETISFGKLH